MRSRYSEENNGSSSNNDTYMVSDPHVMMEKQAFFRYNHKVNKICPRGTQKSTEALKTDTVIKVVET